MPPETRISPHNYTGPLKVNLSGVSLEEGQALIGAARLMIGRRAAAADAGEVPTFSGWFTTQSGITIKVMRAYDMYLATISRPADTQGELDTQAGKAYPSALGGVVVDGYILQEMLVLPTAEGQETKPVDVLDRFCASTTTYQKLSAERKVRQELLVALQELRAKELEETPPPTPEWLLAIDRQIAEVSFELGYYPTARVPTKNLVLALRVPKVFPSAENPVQPPPFSTQKPKIFSQYRLIKPTMFTGRMRVLAQFVMGYGRKVVRGVPGSVDYSIRSANDPQADDYLGALRYWFMFNKTHGVYRTEGGRYYLIEVSRDRGVLAMRLPVFPGTKWALPDAMKDHFDNLPLGYEFPRDFVLDGEAQSPFTLALAQGWVVQLLGAEELADFYKLTPTYQECGWAFSYSGRQISNVGYRVANPRPYDFKTFEHWRIELAGGDEGEDLDDYRLETRDGYDASIGTLTARIERVEQGSAVDLARNGQALKVPTVDSLTGVPAVISLDLLPNGYPRAPGAIVPGDYQKAIKSYPVCDATVHVFYDGEELVWLRFFNPGGEIKTESGSWDDRADVPAPGYIAVLLGNYTWGSYTRPLAMGRGFYSNRVDPRKRNEGSYTNMQSAGRKTGETPYMGVGYSFPYPPFQWGYSDSFNDEWNTDFDPSYRSRVGSPWTAKRHSFSVKITGERVVDQAYTYAAAVPLTDRECFLVYERNFAATRDVYNHQYTAIIMNFVYYTYPSWVPDPGLPFDRQILPAGDWEWWQLRDDTVKYMVYRYIGAGGFDPTKEKVQTISTVLNIAEGTWTLPVNDYNQDVLASGSSRYTVHVVDSALGGNYPLVFGATDADAAVWENTLPTSDGLTRCAFLWLTKSVLGAESYKQHLRLDGNMGYAGAYSDALSGDELYSVHRQITHIGET